MYILTTQARGVRPASPGCAYFLFSSSLVLLWTAMRADPRGAGRAHFPWSSWSLRESHRRQVVPGLLFFSCCLQENRGTERVEPRARSLIAAGRLAMLAAVQGDNGEGEGPRDARAHPRTHQDHAS